MVTICWTQAHRLAGTRRLMIKILKTSHCYLTTNQSEESSWAATLTPNVAFKNHSLKAIWEFGSFEHKLPILPAWHRAINTVLSFITTLVSVDWLFCEASERTQVWFGNAKMGMPGPWQSLSLPHIWWATTSDSSSSYLTWKRSSVVSSWERRALEIYSNFYLPRIHKVHASTNTVYSTVRDR